MLRDCSSQRKAWATLSDANAGKASSSPCLGGFLGPLAHRGPGSTLASHEEAELVKGLSCAKPLSPLKGCCPFLSPYLSRRYWNPDMVSLHSPSTWPLPQAHHKEREEAGAIT